MPDPSLTPRGEKQSEQLLGTFPYHDRIELLVSSPIRRAIYTTLIGFKSDVDRGLKVVALPDAQETSDLPCDTGGSVEKLQEEFGKDGKVDLSFVKEGWNVKVGLYHWHRGLYECIKSCAIDIAISYQRSLVLEVHGLWVKLVDWKKRA